MDIPERVKRIVSEQGDVDAKDITPESRFVEDLGFDSLGLVELILAIEDEYSIEIPDEEAENLKTFNDLVNYVTNAKASK